MAIDGAIAHSRVFGDYGPDSAPTILTELLAGSGYNFMLVGSNESGAPKRLLLTVKSGEPLPTPAGSANAQNTNDDEEQDRLGPGAVPNVPPPPSDDLQIRMQQNLQRLEQMRQHQNETQPPP